MRDWVLPLAPIAIVTYFLAFPDQLGVFETIFVWLGRVAH